MGKPDCFLLALNPFSDLSNDEFFRPRNNTAKKEFQFWISYVGTPNEKIDWMP